MSPTTSSPAPLDETALKVTDAARKVTDAALKSTDARVTKPMQKKKVKSNGFKNNNARVALRKMHVFCESISRMVEVGHLP